ncbi:MAG: hypothetical protein K0R34_2127 [Herbinix sp.]|jgi:hypothetical protein|nr:hypothetical protein [Herbinix sp.]
MNIIKVVFINNGIATGRHYTYFSKEKVEVGDTVQINSSSRGLVAEVDVPEEEIKNYKDKVKFIYGKVSDKQENSQEETPIEENGGIE